MVRPMYCEHCPGNGEMCYDCEREYVAQQRAETSTPPNKPAPWFYAALAVGAALALALVVWACWPVGK